MNRLMECVPNFSEGRNKEVIEKIIDTVRGKDGVKLLDYSSDADHNRTVVTLVGTPEGIKPAIKEFCRVAKDLIDLRKHEGQHPRMGAVDVIPFIPISGITKDEAVAFSKEVAKELYEELEIPSFLYEDSASTEKRRNLATLRKGQFEGMREKVKDPEFHPDFGETIHDSFGIVAIGARPFLIAFNINLATSDLAIADRIAKDVRFVGGGLRYVKAMGVKLEERNITQVSMNCTDFTKTPLHRVFEMVKREAARYGVNVLGSEIIGLLPLQAVSDTFSWYLQTEIYSADQILEKKIME
ncbi:glutamate formimidoyltransferase [Guggenheimella bovis]